MFTLAISSADQKSPHRRRYLVSDKLEETCAHVMYTGCVESPRLFLTRIVLCLPPGYYYTLYTCICATTKTAAHTAPHRLDNQIRFLPTPLQTRHYAQTEFPLHFVPETTFHPFRNRETYLFIFIFSHPQFPFSRHFTLASRSFSYNSVLADITLFKGKKKILFEC